MAVVKLILGSTTGGGGTFSNKIVNSGNTLSNASIKTNNQNEFLNTTNMNKNGREMLSWGNNGILRFNSNGKLSNNGIDAGKLVSEAKPDMLVFGAVPSNKEYSVKLVFKGTKNVKGIVVYGDKVANQFATEAILNGVKTIYSGEYKMEINFNSNSDEQIVEFIKWNRANYNASFSQISVSMNNYEVNRSNGLKNVESLSQSTAQNNQIHYGVIANSGNVEVLDTNGEIKKLVLDGTLPISNMPVQIICNGKQIQSHISVDSDYDNNSKTLNIEFTNDLANWDNLQYKGYAYPKKSENAYNMLLDVFVSIGYTQEQVDEMLATEIVYVTANTNGTIKEYLEQITIPYPYLPQASVRETIDKFCTLAQLQVFKTDEDKIKFVSARPIATDEEKEEAIFIDKSSIFGNFTRAILLKNKYDTIELSTKKIEDKVEYDTIVYAYLNNSLNNFVFKDKKFEGGFYPGASIPIAFKLESFYVSGEVEIYKKSNLGLKEILSVDVSGSVDSDGFYTLTKKNNAYNFSVNYDTKTGKFKDEKTAFNDIKDPYNTSSKFATTNYYSNVISDTLKETTNGKIPVSYSSKSADSAANGKTISLSDNSYLKIKDMGEYFLLKYYVLARVVYYDLDLAYTTLGGYTGFRGSPRITINEAVNLTVSIYGSEREISFENDSSDNDITNNKTVVKISNSELIQEDSGLFTTYNKNFATKIDGDNVIVTAKHIIPEDVELTFTGVDKDDYLINEQYTFEGGIKTKTYNIPNVAEIQVSEVFNLDTGDEMGDLVIGTKISTIIKDNIKSDYVNGISNASMTVACVDYYSTNKRKIKDWSKGETFEVGDIVKVEGDDNLWRVTGRNFKKGGVPEVELQLQQIK